MNAASCRLIVIVSILLTLGTTVSCGKSHVQAAGEDRGIGEPTAGEIMTIDDKNFLIAAEKAEVRERALAMLAFDKTGNPAVREFAREVIEHRDRDIARLASMMKQKHMAQGSIIAEGIELQASQRLHRLSGDALDREFVSLMTADQQQAIRIFSRAAETSPDSDIRNYAMDALPSIRKDFDAAAKLEQAR